MASSYCDRSTSNWHDRDYIASPQQSQYEEAIAPKKKKPDFFMHTGFPSLGDREKSFSRRWITTSYFDGG